MKKTKEETLRPGRAAKLVLILSQGALAGLITLCLLLIWVISDGESPFTNVGRSFENTPMFMQTVESIVREKIGCDQNLELFEPSGTPNEERLIDIRQYAAGTLDEASGNRYTTYRLCDLLSFASSGAEELEETIFSLLGQGMSESEVGAALMDRSAKLETVMPISGVSLADYAQLNVNPAATAMECYRELFESSLDIAARHEEYLLYEPDEASSEAPSNIAYYIENTGTRQRYTNQRAASMQTAQYRIAQQDNMTVIFEGERKFNIMVADTQKSFSERVSDYFMQIRFVGTGEKVLIAVDLDYPLGDELREAYVRYQQRMPWMAAALAGAVCAAAALLVLFILTCRGAGRSAGDKKTALLLPFDQIPTEIAAGLCLIAAIIWWMFAGRVIASYPDWTGKRVLLLRALRTAVEYEIFLAAVLSFLRRLRVDTLWKNSVCYYVVQGTRQVYSARRSSQRLLLTYAAFIACNLLFLIVGGAPGMIMALILNMAALLYLMRDVVGKQNVREGLSQLSKGRLDYRINTEVLTGESREMGEAVNEMGDGLQKAVESMLKGERLKAELITNVSHDLKTPLTSIVSYVDLLGKEELPGERAREYVRILEQKTLRLKQLTEDLIEVSRISSGNVELHPVTLQLKDFILQACGEFEDRLLERGIHLKMELPGENIPILADGASLWRVFENLLGNIVKYAAENTTALVRLTKEEEEAVVLFSNEAASEFPDDGSRLMERFVRGDESRGSEGSGLGLSIADSLTKLMNGRLTIRTEGKVFQAKLSFPAQPSGAPPGISGTDI